MDMIRDVCHYFYDNRNFYRKALKIEGQNSFSEHFRVYITPLLKLRLTYLFGDCDDEFTLNFFTDAIVCTIERWLRKKDCMPPDQFFARLMNTILRSVETLYKELNHKE